MVTEQSFLRAITARPDDDVTRLVFADWLEERADHVSRDRAEFIRLDYQLFCTPNRDTAQATIRDRLMRKAWFLPTRWKAVVGHGWIEQCPGHAADCPADWTRLEPVREKKERRCDVCQQVVRYCATVREAQERVRSGPGRPLVVDVGEPRAHRDLNALPPLVADQLIPIEVDAEEFFRYW